MKEVKLILWNKLKFGVASLTIAVVIGMAAPIHGETNESQCVYTPARVGEESESVT